MSKHLKNIIIDGLADTCATFVSLPPNSTPHTKGVRYFTLCEGINYIRGAMDDLAPGLKRYSRFYQYTYVCIYRALQEAAKAEQQKSSLGAPNDNSEVDFEPIEPRDILSRPVKIRSSIPLDRVFDQKSVPKFAYMQKKL